MSGVPIRQVLAELEGGADIITGFMIICGDYLTSL